jgi:1,4-alpha-glucan branching enzyme
MHDTLKYFQTDPFFRAGNHNSLTFGLVYAWSENFILPFSHDEVVHMKGSLLNKMPGTEEQKFATLRALYAYMWAHPGKKLLFMGGEFGQWREWTETESLDWHLLEDALHSGIQNLIRDLNRVYLAEESLWQADGEAAGFEWIDVDNAAENIVAFIRRSAQSDSDLICISNFSAVARNGYRLGLPGEGQYQCLINTDQKQYGGEEAVFANLQSEPVSSHGRQHSALIDLPALTTIWLKSSQSPEQ